MDWIVFRRSKDLQVSRKVAIEKALLTNQEMAPSQGKCVKFKASRGWLEKFMRRNNLSLRTKTSVAHC